MAYGFRMKLCMRKNILDFPGTYNKDVWLICDQI